MYKKLLLAIIITFIAGCSSITPQPKSEPNWYTNIPKNKLLFYSVGQSDNTQKARTKAVAFMRKRLANEITRYFKATTHTLQPLDKKTLEKITAENDLISKKLLLNHTKLVKSEQINGTTFVLISIYKEELFQALKIVSEAKMSRVKYEKNIITVSNNLENFVALHPLMQQYYNLASLTQYKEFLHYQYDSDNEFRFLKTLKDEYDALQSALNIYILADEPSKYFSKIIQQELISKELRTSNTTQAKEPFKLLITTKTTNSQEYHFKKSKSLVKLILLDKNKNIIAFKQHTFESKSKKSYQDAKEQSAIKLKNKIEQMGIFSFIGLKKY